MIIDEEFEGIELERLQAYIENGRVDEMPEEFTNYLRDLEVVRSQLDRSQSRKNIIKLLQTPVYGLSAHIAAKRYADAINFFYVDTHIKKTAYRNLYAQEMELAARFVKHTMKTSQDAERYVKMLEAAGKMRELDKAEVEKTDPAAYRKPNKVYTLDAEYLGIPLATKGELTEYIDGLDIPEAEKIRLKSESGATNPKLMLDHGED